MCNAIELAMGRMVQLLSQVRSVLAVEHQIVQKNECPTDPLDRAEDKMSILFAIKSVWGRTMLWLKVKPSVPNFPPGKEL